MIHLAGWKLEVWGLIENDSEKKFVAAVLVRSSPAMKDRIQPHSCGVERKRNTYRTFTAEEAAQQLPF